LSDANLANADLTGATLNGANLSDARLDGAQGIDSGQVTEFPVQHATVRRVD
jgi:uncharacterized protein YjbI with pentapeptide repeats